MKEETPFDAWQNSYNSYARQLLHSGIDLDALATQLLCDVKTYKEETKAPTNKYEYILIGR